MLTGSVQVSEQVECTGSAVRAPSGKATLGEVGATRASNPAAHSRSKSCLISVRDLLRLEVERVVVAGRQRVRAQHDPALDLWPEALAPRGEVVRKVVVPATNAVAEPDAVVAGEVGGRLRRGDDVVRGEAVVRVGEAGLPTTVRARHYAQRDGRQ